jgi:hypothetical protein
MSRIHCSPLVGLFLMVSLMGCQRVAVPNVPPARDDTTLMRADPYISSARINYPSSCRMCLKVCCWRDR